MGLRKEFWSWRTFFISYSNAVHNVGSNTVAVSQRAFDGFAANYVMNVVVDGWLLKIDEGT
ncbi:hypothetical protein BYT27DRAFT_7184805 [Phlegmacium glaucopus]|nr:hypothetical protein BYT27DRAFT_7184805 [Phlegmacium glaucopus]